MSTPVGPNAGPVTGRPVTEDFSKYLTGEQRDAFLLLQSRFREFGLETLAPKIFDYIKNGYSTDTIYQLLQETPEYKNRFAGNELRKKEGLPVLPPAEYLAVESSYRQILQTAGLPKGFYDQPSDFNDWIGRNVSPSEIQNRVDLATQATVLANPSYRQALNLMGISDNDLTAYFLDQKRALPYLQKAAATAAVGAGALSQGLTFDKVYAEQLATQGVTAEQAREGYAQIGAELPELSKLGSIYGEEFNQRTAEQAVFEGQGQAITKRRRLASQERAQFGGAAGAARSGLSQRGGQY